MRCSSAMRSPPRRHRRSEVGPEASGSVHEATGSISPAVSAAIVGVLVAALRTRNDTPATVAWAAGEKPCVASQHCDPRQAGRWRSEVACEAPGAAHDATDSFSPAERSAILRVSEAARRTRTDTLATAGRAAGEKQCVVYQCCDPRHAGRCGSGSRESCRLQTYGWRCLPVNVMACTTMLMLLGPKYQYRLWCIWEIFTCYDDGCCCKGPLDGRTCDLKEDSAHDGHGSCAFQAHQTGCHCTTLPVLMAALQKFDSELGQCRETSPGQRQAAAPAHVLSISYAVEAHQTGCHCTTLPELMASMQSLTYVVSMSCIVQAFHTGCRCTTLPALIAKMLNFV